LPVLDEQEREALLAQLAESEAQIKAGNYTLYDPKAFKERMLRIYRDNKRLGFMIFELRIAPRARQHIDELSAYLAKYDERFANQQMDRLNRTFNVSIRRTPLAWGNFPLTGAPYRGYLFQLPDGLTTGSFMQSMKSAAQSI
jgi:hypothetical protein